MEDITKIDLYELLCILPSATKQDVKKAYRKSALKCHPDKNPDNPKAAELFHQLSRALEILTDDSARAAYDKVLNAKKAAILRNKELDSKRKKLKEDLEERERRAQHNSGFQEKSAEEKLKAEVERLRKEGSKQLEEEIELVRAEIKREKFATGTADIDNPSLFRLKVTWKTQPNGDTYNHDNLEKIFSKYGEIAALVVSDKKKGNALLEFISPMDAVKAQNLEKGFMSNPLTVHWLTGKAPREARTPSAPDPATARTPMGPVGGTVFPSMNPSASQRKTFPCFSPTQDMFSKSRQEKQDSDFEAAVLLRMRQAQEEKRKQDAMKES